jgi:phosphoglycerate dehydrogenase-like enzyme
VRTAKILVAVSNELLPTVMLPQDQHRLDGLGQVLWRKDIERGPLDPVVRRQRSDELLAVLREVQPEILVSFWNTPTVPAAALRDVPALRYICHLGGTVRHHVARELIAGGVLVSNWGTIISRTIAEAALMMVLNGLRLITEVTLEMHVRRGWRLDEKQHRSLFERSVGLHGLGPIAQDLVPLLAPFHCKVSAYSPHCPDEVFEKLAVAKVGDLRTLYASNDVISIHTGDTPENHHIVDAELLAAMPDGAVLINTARGGIVDTDALVAELRTGRIAASLDVFETEPLPADSPLRGLENCQLIPHMAGPTLDRRVDCGTLAVDNIARYLRGEPVLFPVSLHKYDTAT